MDLNEVKGLITEQNRLFGEFKTANDKALAEIKTFGEALGETKIEARRDRRAAWTRSTYWSSSSTRRSRRSSCRRTPAARPPSSIRRA
jgi:hypothetical protein